MEPIFLKVWYYSMIEKTFYLVEKTATEKIKNQIREFYGMAATDNEITLISSKHVQEFENLFNKLLADYYTN